MYDTHARYIQRAVAIGGAPELGHVVRFTLATIRFPLWQAAKASRALLTGEGDVDAARRQVLWGSKAAGFAYLESQEGRETLKTAWLSAQYRGSVPTLLDLCRIPGLGMVKAGFVCQMAFGFGGCIDTHNLRLYGVPTSAVSLGGVQLHGKAAQRKAGAYLRLCDRLGGPERLWDTWCRFVADTQPQRYFGANDVSYQHLIGMGYAS